jgi:hypothetical protein
MSDFIAARSQMALSLGFHIVFSCIGMVMPFFMAVAHYYWLKTDQIVYKNVTKAWSKGVAIFFATGAVSGTVLSFELGLLWPGFMKHAGPIFGMPFSLEGTAFFIEAIALGFFLYGWDRFNKWFHWFTGVIVGVSGLASGILVVAANAWMNSPAGFDHINGQYLNIDPDTGYVQRRLVFAGAAYDHCGIRRYGLCRGRCARADDPERQKCSFSYQIIYHCRHVGLRGSASSTVERRHFSQGRGDPPARETGGDGSTFSY